MMLTYMPFLHDGILRAAFVHMTAVAKQIQHTMRGGGKVAKRAWANQLTSKCTFQ